LEDFEALKKLVFATPNVSQKLLSTIAPYGDVRTEFVPLEYFSLKGRHS
jgi:hypothetical protein